MAKTRKPKRTKPKTKGQQDNGEAKRIEVLANKMMKPAIGCDLATVLPSLAFWMTLDSSHTKFSKLKMADSKYPAIIE
jgi:hypothetical protein